MAIYFLFVMLLTFFGNSSARSVHRTPAPQTPILSAQWQKGGTIFQKKDVRYSEYPLFKTYDHRFFMKHQLPKKTIANLATPSEAFSGVELHEILEKLVQEVKTGKPNLAEFEIIQDKNFNFSMKCGLLVLKFKKFPFVVKLFMETPETFVYPIWKGFEPVFFFYMSGGANRHIAGFTRIKNRVYIQKWAAKHPVWKDHIKIPRKWFWVPKDPDWIAVRGENISDHVLQTVLPGTYAVVADYHNEKEDPTLATIRKDIIMQLCNDLNLFIDPHDNNFIVTRHSKTSNPFITVIDTEHFPTIVGLKEPIQFNNHWDWLYYLASKMLQDAYFCTKSQRLYTKNAYNALMLTI